MRPTVLLAALPLLGAGCKGCGPADEEVDLLCAEPSSGATELVGDANADGALDVSDGVFLHRRLRMGGPPPVCEPAMDVLVDGHVDGADAFALWAHLFTGTTALPAFPPGACDAPTALVDGECGLPLFAWSASERVIGPEGEPGRIPVALTLTPGGLPVSAWSVSAVSEGCTILEAELEGTAGAESFDDLAGRRGTGFQHTEVVGDQGAISAVVLSWMEESALAPDDPAVTILQLTLEATPTLECASCTIRLEDGGDGAGEPVRNVVTVEGRSFRPALPEATILVCAE